MAQHYSVLTILDKTGEKSSLKVYNGAITAVSLPGFLTDFGNLKTKTDALVLGTINSEMWVGDSNVLSEALPASNFAQRETKILVQYRGNTSNKLFTLTIPCPDLALVNFVPLGKDAISITAPAAVSEWVTAFQTIARSPDDDGENVTVVGMKVVGRNI